MPTTAMWHAIKSGVIMSCDTCVFHVGARHDGTLKGSLGRSNRRINIIAATSRAEEGKHQELHEQIRSRVTVSPGRWLDTSGYKMSSF